MNTQVTATGMQVKAVAEGGIILIKNEKNIVLLQKDSAGIKQISFDKDALNQSKCPRIFITFKK